MIAIGIDPGTTTGFAVWDSERFALRIVASMPILSCMDSVLEWHRMTGGTLIVIVEDARKRVWGFSKMDKREDDSGSAVREGVGSVKRDCAIWEEFLTRNGIPYELRHPRGTKMKAPDFKRLTGWPNITNVHARDAAMIVFQLNSPILSLKLKTYHEQRESPSGKVSLPAGARFTKGRRR